MATTTKKKAPARKAAAAKAERPAVLGCRVEGCPNPRWVLKTGHVVPRCQTHENERSKAWHAAKRLAQKSEVQKPKPAAAAKGVILSLASAKPVKQAHVPAELVARRQAEKAAHQPGGVIPFPKFDEEGHELPLG